ncbi:aminotransferase class V-fold PLP-dependent enzyme [Legionella sp. PATHC038]|uniref:aminotransferase class V-fold PLP-dependent enzyme n=1 Tax=Legionella sheltonii TaxID=2992041 RepID=UPI002244A27F|nr:aminotransferase class V-fold PLP-dependent enzyme [Legionella sp. PATHC038]MCW8397896.1 aminotransferase class V-fold PLP-dependent enzyme [Legionella sp. PATHC038]
MMKELIEAMVSNPDEFIRLISEKPGGFSLEYATYLDSIDPLNSVHELFEFEGLRPFAGHSLGPVFKPAVKEIERINKLQATQLHEGHFPETHKHGGNWFDCDIDEEAINAMQEILGFSEPCEFLYTQEGLSSNLGRLVDTFYRPTLFDWQSGKTGICHLGKEFFSDQAVIESVLKRGIQTAKNFGVFRDPKQVPSPTSLTLKILPDEQGLYSEEAVIHFVKNHAAQIQILHLSDIVFSTGQRLDITHILTELKDTIEQYPIIVGLDLAHTIGNRTLNLRELPVTYAVGCGYKHICGSAGSGFGIYVNKNTDLEKYPPIQGWKAAASEKVFDLIDGYDSRIMMQKGAWAFRCSNPSPVALAPVKTYIKTMSQVGWHKLNAKSECLTRYMQALIQQHLGDKIEWITPDDPKKRGAMLVFRVKEISDVKQIEALLKKASDLGTFEIDVRPPNNIRVTAHYGYTQFTDIHKMVSRLEQVVHLLLEQKKLETFTLTSIKQRRQSGFFEQQIEETAPSSFQHAQTSNGVYTP